MIALKSTTDRLMARTMLSIFISLAFLARAQPYTEIRAEITTTTYEEDGDEAALGRMHSFSVVCVTGTNRWRIDTDYLRGAESAWLFDGTNVFEAIRVVAPASERTRHGVQTRFGLAVVPFEIARSNLTINVRPSRDGHPRGHLGVNLPWLAFCSDAYLKQPDRIVPLPDAILRHAPDGFAYADKTQTFDDEFRLPQAIELVTSKSLYRASVQREDFAGKRDVDVWKHAIADFPEGALKFRYSVTRSTNFLNRTFPLEFEFTHHERRKDGSWFVPRRGKGIVTSLRESSSPKHIFDPPLQRTIVDYRFPDAAKPSHAIVYRSTNSVLAPRLVEVQKIKRASDSTR